MSRLFSHLKLDIESQHEYIPMPVRNLFHTTIYRFSTFTGSPHELHHSTKLEEIDRNPFEGYWAEYYSEERAPVLGPTARFVRTLDIRGTFALEVFERVIHEFTGLETLRLENTMAGIVENATAPVEEDFGCYRWVPGPPPPIWLSPPIVKAPPAPSVTLHVYVFEDEEHAMFVNNLPNPLAHIYIIADPGATKRYFKFPLCLARYNHVPVTFVCSEGQLERVRDDDLKFLFQQVYCGPSHPLFNRGLMRISHEEYAAQFGRCTFRTRLNDDA